MKLITGHYKKLALIECSCCRESHTLELSMDRDDKMLWFTTNERSNTWLYKFKNWIKLKKNPELYISGECRNFFELLLTRSQIKEIVEVLEKEEYNISDKFNITSFKVDEHTIGCFDKNGILLGQEEDCFIIALHPREEDDLWNCSSGEFCNALDELEVNHFLSALKCLLGERD